MKLFIFVITAYLHATTYSVMPMKQWNCQTLCKDLQATSKFEEPNICTCTYTVPENADDGHVDFKKKHADKMGVLLNLDKSKPEAKHTVKRSVEENASKQVVVGQSSPATHRKRPGHRLRQSTFSQNRASPQNLFTAHHSTPEHISPPRHTTPQHHITPLHTSPQYRTIPHRTTNLHASPRHSSQIHSLLPEHHGLQTQSNNRNRASTLLKQAQERIHQLQEHQQQQRHRVGLPSLSSRSLVGARRSKNEHTSTTVETAPGSASIGNETSSAPPHQDFHIITQASNLIDE